MIFTKSRNFLFVGLGISCVCIQLAYSQSSVKSSAITPVSIPISNTNINSLRISRAIPLGNTEVGNIVKYRYEVGGTPHDTVSDYTMGPGSMWSYLYGPKNEYFHVTRTSGELGIVWQDKSSKEIRLMWLSENLTSPSAVVKLANNRNELLTAVTYDNMGNLYYLTVQGGNGVNEKPGDAPENDVARTASLYVVNASGRLLRSRSLDTGNNEIGASSSGALNLVELFKGSLQYSNGQLALMLGRILHETRDTLNHQSGSAFVFDANTLEVVKNHGQTSGHSIDHILTTNSNGDFLALDSGDNFPRGLHLHVFNRNERRSRVVYTYKTAMQGNRSNDNNTYTEIGGLIEGNNGYTVIFSGERSPNGHSLDNNRTGASFGNGPDDPRNIGVVYVRKNFPVLEGRRENGQYIRPSLSVVTDDVVVNPRNAETGNYYDFRGQLNEQRNTGVVWLTSYTDKREENVSRLKTVKLSDGSLFLMWEKWRPNNYVSTYAMRIDEAGRQLTEPVELPTDVRIDRTSEPWAIGNNVYTIVGRKEGVIELIIIHV